MRFLVKVTFPVEAGNEAARAGTLGETIGRILEEQKPEAAYFFAQDGERGGIIILDMESADQIPAIAEPWFLALDASIEIQPVMTPEDLQKAGPSIAKAVQTFG
ncbi:MAG: DUF3303 family protein [Dehalococcoidia bacterium]